MKFRYLHIKLATVFGLCFLIIIGGLIAYGVISARQTERFIVGFSKASISEAAKEQLLEKARNIGLHVRRELETALDASRILADVLASIKDETVGLKADRSRISIMLRSVLIKNEIFVGVYTGWEPNAFDNLDDIYVSTEGHDQSGRFIPYWCRNDKGNIASEPLTDYENQEKYNNGVRKGEYYLLAREQKRETAIDPYPRMIQGKEVWISSLIVPIVVKDKFYGIAGVDMSIDFIQELIRRANAGFYNGSGRIAVITFNGIIAAVSDKPELIGKHLKECIGDTHRESRENIRAAKEHIEMTADGYLRVIVPMHIGRSKTPWAVMVEVPAKEVTSKVRVLETQLDHRLTHRLLGMILTGVGFFLAALLAIWLLSQSISAPITRVIKGLGENYEQLLAASSQVSAAGLSLSDSANIHAASLQQTTSSLEHISEMIRQNADHADNARQMMSQTFDIVNKVSGYMSDVVSAIDDIRTSGEKSGKIIKTIDELAFQTDLLALNAAIEAARAGEAGAGFAVVANEVKTLAMRVSQAAQTTSALIENTIVAVQKGHETTAMTRHAFSENMNLSAKVNDLVAEIAVASSEQSQGVEDLNRTVRELERVNRENSANAEQTASAAGELKAQAEKMKLFIEELRSLIGTNLG